MSPQTTSLARQGLVVPWAVVLAGVFAIGCSGERATEFVCGTRRPGTETVRLCNRLSEVCVCATGGCAVADTGCDSGLRYVSYPFQGALGIANECVDEPHALSAIDQGDGPAECKEADAGVEVVTEDAGFADADIGATDGGA